MAASHLVIMVAKAMLDDMTMRCVYDTMVRSVIAAMVLQYCESLKQSWLRTVILYELNTNTTLKIQL